MVKEWLIFRKRYIPAILPILDYWSWDVGGKLNITRGITVNIWENGWYTAIWEKQGKESIANHALKQMFENDLKSIREDGISSGKNVVNFCENFVKGLENKTFENFVKFYEELKVLYNKFIEKSMVYWLFTGSLIETKIKPLLENYSKEDQETILNIMTIPRIASYSQVEEEDFENILKLAKEKGLENYEVKSLIEDFSKKYFWFPYEYVGPDVWNIETVTKRVKESLDNHIPKDYTKNVSKEQDECIQKFNLSDDLVKLFNVLQIATLMQDDRKMFNAQACYYINGIIAENLARKLNVSVEQLHYLDIGLLEKYLDDNDSERLIKELDKRKNFLLVLQTDEGNQFFTGSEAKEKLKELNVEFKQDLSEITEIKGRTACQGKIKGKVKVLLTSSGVENFNEGDILVTPMTTPDFVPIMGKAGAIVTDEGGITCHAAIVSREMKIPCVVGTEIATKVLHDGDLVEVDANTGVVRKVE